MWPILTDIDADLVFERASMTITAQRGRAYGARIEQAMARIAHLGRDATLDVKGQVAGPLADLLRYANASPVKGWIGGITDGAEAQGNARLDLGLLIPLGHAADARVNGAIAFQNNNLALAGLPPFTRTSGTLNFHERGVRINNLSTNLLGGAARLDASTRADGALLFNAAGSATPAGLRGAVPFAPLQRLLDKSSGSARYQAAVVVKDGTELRIDSDLTGLAIDGIAPLRKSAAENLPFRIERTTRAAVDDLQVQAGRALGVRIERRRTDATGELRFDSGRGRGERAGQPSGAGLARHRHAAAPRRRCVVEPAGAGLRRRHVAPARPRPTTTCTSTSSRCAPTNSSCRVTRCAT